MTRPALGWSTVLAVLLAGSGTLGCFYPLHEPPAAGRPAATVKFRLGHHYRPSGHVFGASSVFNPTNLRSVLTIDNRRLPYDPVASGVAATWTRVKPGWRAYRLASYYVQTYWVTERVPYTATEYTTCSKYECSYSSSTSRYGSSSRCGYRTTPCTKYVTKYRNERRMRTRRLANCADTLAVHMRQGVTYLLTWNYVGPHSCRITCHQQVFQKQGGFRLEPCAHVQN